MKNRYDSGIYMVVSKGLFIEKDLIDKMPGWGLKNIDEILTTLKETGRWTDGKLRIMTAK